MEYTSLFEPMLCICLSLCLGVLIGCIATLYVSVKEHKAINEELNAKNIELIRKGDEIKYWVDKWKQEQNL